MNLIQASEWLGGRTFGNIPDLNLPVSLFVIHHAPERAVTVNASPAEEIRELRIIHDYHRATPQNPRPNPAGITAGGAYAFVVTPAGRIYVMRGHTKRGAHSGAINDRSLGILCLWNGMFNFPAPGVVALSQLAMHLVEIGAMRQDWRADFHRNYRATTCPGDALVRQLNQLEQAPPEVVRPPIGSHPKQVWSNTVRGGTWLTVTRVVSDAEWYYAISQDLARVGAGEHTIRIHRAHTPLSRMPEGS
jgi:hypothetical protein